MNNAYLSSPVASFSAATLPVLDSLPRQLANTWPIQKRWEIFKQIAAIAEHLPAQSEKALQMLPELAAGDKDAGIRYLSAGLLRDLTLRQPILAGRAAQGIALLATHEQDAYGRRNIELSLIKIAETVPDTATIAAGAIAQNLLAERDVLARCLQAQQLSALCDIHPAVAKTIASDLIEAFRAEPEKLAAYQLSRTLVKIAEDAALRPAILETLISSMTAPASAAHPMEKSFAAAQGLHQMAAAGGAQDVTAAMANRLTETATSGPLGDTARRLCILGLCYLATDTACTQTAAGALIHNLAQEPTALYRRHIVDGVMTSVQSGFDLQTAAKALSAHLDMERDRETRDKIQSSLRRLGQPMPAFKTSTPALKA